MTQPVRYTGVPEFWDQVGLESGTIEHLRKLGSRINEILLGKTNCVYLVTLTPDTTSTVLTAAGASVQTQAYLSARSATAATALASGDVWCETAKNQVTIHHDSSPSTDRTFGVALLG